jgi:hypothetical protein
MACPGARHQPWIVAERPDDMTGEFRRFSSALQVTIFFRIQGELQSIRQQSARSDRERRYLLLREVDGPVGGHLVHARLVRNLGGSVGIVNSAGRRRNDHQTVPAPIIGAAYQVAI